MKVIIAGSRTIYPSSDRDTHPSIGLAIKESGFEVTEVVSGNAKGVDRSGEDWAKTNNVPVKIFKPEWRNGKGAGLERNEEMGRYADALIAFWDGKSTGTKHMITFAKRRGLKVHVVIVND